MLAAPHLLLGHVMHKRLTPRVNAFTYGIYYLALPLSQLGTMALARNRFAALSFYDRDHGARDGGDLAQWMRGILAAQNITEADGEIILITMPRVLGYVFNPVSFWLCHDKNNRLRAVLCEVNNTFGESHNYLCLHADRRPIEKNDWIEGEKYFHVSPFMEIAGTYRFRFDATPDSFATCIDYHETGLGKKLLTTLYGKFTDMTPASLRRVFWRYPLVTLKAIFLIHWQAVRLFAKGVRYVPKPPQREITLTVTNKMKKL